MKYIINHSNDTAFNIALEEYAFKHLLDEDQIFLLWINKPSIIVGRHQNTIEEINRDYVRENGIEVVRRISGGGAVYHDLNNLNYTIISKEDEKMKIRHLTSRASQLRLSIPWLNLGLKLSSQVVMTLRLMVRSSVAMPKPISTAVSCTTVACSLTLICQSSQMPLRFQKINLNQKV